MREDACTREAMTSAPRRAEDWLSLAFLGAAVILPTAFAASHAASITDTAHDLEVSRVLGLAPTGFRALDTVISAPFVILPFGDRALRASLASVAMVGMMALVMFDLVRDRAAHASSTRLVAYVALVVSAVATLAPATQMEATSVGGATLGALLALLPRWLHARGHDVSRIALALGLALAYEPLLGACAIVSLVGSRALFASCSAFGLGCDGRSS